MLPANYPSSTRPQITRNIPVTEREGAAILWLIDFMLDPRGRNALRGTIWVGHLESLETKLKELGYENPYEDPVPHSAR